MNRFTGTQKILGVKAQEKLSQSHICLIGIGGVGSWTAEALIRSGIGKITLIDLDEICISNTNRQVHTNSKNIGHSKIEEMKKRLLLINPLIEVSLIHDFYTPNSSESILNQSYDLIIDAIDDASNKAHLISESMKRKIPIITIGAAGGKIDPSLIKVKDLAFSHNDYLLSRVRRDLRQKYYFSKFSRKKFHVLSIFSSEEISKPTTLNNQKLNCNGELGSICSLTATMGFRAAHEAIKLITQND